ncbi:EF-hand domain-containing protein [Chitinimonas koreensis]|uniref:EF-hand domain-containing protein n=1 Tax=Chitinimonas koreensis TaxID=356302 RepID=UPI00041E7741|nr:EF-hand domain-containing protein [Chitinimonas koreensis]QNM95287.1 EF-hand domain-containing protein [Chitinimonas koreensis]
MTSAITSGGSYGYSSYAVGGQRPDPAAMRQKLFEKIDSDGDGGLSETELTAFTEQADKAKRSQGSQGVQAPSFSDMDSDGDSALSQDEFSSGMQKLEAQLQSQFNAMRQSGGMGGGGMGGPPPGPPPGGGAGGPQAAGGASGQDRITELFKSLDSDEDGSVSEDEFGVLAQALNGGKGSESSTSSSSGTSSVSSTSDSGSKGPSFSKLDTDGDGKVSMAEFEAGAPKRQNRETQDNSGQTGLQALVQSLLGGGQGRTGSQFSLLA